jgi:methylmalonyl-CoA carboxyltransferase small subunit
MKLRITVEGKIYEVDVEVVGDESHGLPHGSAPPSGMAAPGPQPAEIREPHTPSRPVANAPAGEASDRVVKAPIVGTIMQLKGAAGDTGSGNQVLLVMEAMKMETNVASPLAGKVKTICVAPGEAVKAGQVLVEFE